MNKFIIVVTLVVASTFFAEAQVRGPKNAECFGSQGQLLRHCGGTGDDRTNNPRAARAECQNSCRERGQDHISECRSRSNGNMIWYNNCVERVQNWHGTCQSNC